MRQVTGTGQRCSIALSSHPWLSWPRFAGRLRQMWDQWDKSGVDELEKWQRKHWNWLKTELTMQWQNRSTKEFWFWTFLVLICVCLIARAGVNSERIAQRERPWEFGSKRHETFAGPAFLPFDILVCVWFLVILELLDDLVSSAASTDLKCHYLCIQVDLNSSRRNISYLLLPSGGQSIQSNTNFEPWLSMTHIEQNW